MSNKSIVSILTLYLSEIKSLLPGTQRSFFNVYTTSIRLERRRLNVTVTLCLYWDLQYYSLSIAFLNNCDVVGFDSCHIGSI